MIYRDSKIILTADDEEPNCMCCDNQDKCTGENCGPEYGWFRYRRVKEIEDETNYSRIK